MLNIVEALRERLGTEAVLDGPAASARARNYWDPAPLQARALVRPGSTVEVSQVMELTRHPCHRYRHTLKLARPNGETSNCLFAILTEWSACLEVQSL